MKVAVVGGGITGLAAAHALRGRAQVTLFEAAERFGGHANTVDVTLDGVTHGVDTGFLVFNDRTYPGLVRLFAELRVPTAASDMSFSVQVPGAFGGHALEWSGSNLNTVFCQRANLLRPRFLRMLRDLLRFNRLCTLLVEAGDTARLDETLGDFLVRARFGPELRDWYLLPMASCIWSCPASQMLQFPIGTLIRFCHNHGLLQVHDRPQWQTVVGGSRRYVEAIVAGLPDARASTPVRRIWRDVHGVTLSGPWGHERFDQVVLAVHSDQALAMLADADPHEAELLGAIDYHPNRAVLHTDASVLPANRSAWAAWNYEAASSGRHGHVCLHYLINRLQPLPWSRPVIVSLNPVRPIAADCVISEFDYAHPVFDAAAVRAQARLEAVQGSRRTWFCGAWTGYGFHEDGLRSGEAAVRRLLLQHSMDHAAEAFA